MTRAGEIAGSTNQSDSLSDIITSVWNAQLTPNDYLESGSTQTVDTNAVIDDQGITFGNPYGDSTFDTIPGFAHLPVEPEQIPEEISVMPDREPEQITVMPEPAPEQLTVMPDLVPEGQSAATGPDFATQSAKEQPRRAVAPTNSWWTPADLAEHARSVATGGKEGDTRAARSIHPLPWGLEVLSPSRLAQVIRDVAYAADRERNNPQLVHASGASTAPSDVNAAPKPAPAPRRQK